MPDNQLFANSHAAMTFAFNYKGNPSMSIMNRMYKSPPGDDDKPKQNNGMTAIDLAAMSGIIRCKLHTLCMLHEAILIADIAPRSQLCPCRSSCCSGKTRNQEWSDAVNWLADNVRVNALDGHRTTHPIRRACVEVYFGAKISVVKIANDLDLSESTAGTMIKKVRHYLRSEQERARIGADDVLDCLIIKG